MKKVYDWREVSAMLMAIAKAAPEGFCYSPREEGACLYFQDGKPDCIIGHLLAKLGFDESIVPEKAGIFVICSLGRAKDAGNTLAYTSAIAEMFTADAVIFMHEVQSAQDDGMPWIDAVSNAHHFMEKLNGDR